MKWKINLSSFLRASIPSSLYAGLRAVALVALVSVGQACAATSTADAGDRAAQLDKIFSRAAQFKVEPHSKHPSVLHILSPSGSDGSVTSAEWCGPRMLRIYFGYSDYIGDVKIPKDHGTYLVELESRTVWRLRPLPGRGRLVNCSVDGNWLIYARTDGKDTIVGRYHLATARYEDFVRLKGVGQNTGGSRFLIAGVWSPGGTKIAYGWKKIDVIKTSEPVWEVFRMRRDFSPGQLAGLWWLGDSSRVLLRYFSMPLRKPNIAIDDSGDPGKPLQVLEPPKGFNGSPELFSVLKPVDSTSLYGVAYYKDSSQHLQRCAISLNNLRCRPAIDGDPKITTAYDVSPDGKTIYYQIQDPSPCVIRYDTTNRKKVCVWPETVLGMGLAPGGRWIAFVSHGIPGNGASGIGIMPITWKVGDAEPVKDLERGGM